MAYGTVTASPTPERCLGPALPAPSASLRRSVRHKSSVASYTESSNIESVQANIAPNMEPVTKHAWEEKEKEKGKKKIIETPPKKMKKGEEKKFLDY